MIQLLLNFSLLIEQIAHFVIAHRFGEFSVNLIIFTQYVNDLLHAFFDYLFNGFIVIEQRFLFKQAYGKAGRYGSLSVEILIDSGQNFQKCAFTRTVQPEYSDLGPVKI